MVSPAIAGIRLIRLGKKLVPEACCSRFGFVGSWAEWVEWCSVGFSRTFYVISAVVKGTEKSGSATHATKSPINFTHGVFKK
jgi:hypothetical protein